MKGIARNIVRRFGLEESTGEPAPTQTVQADAKVLPENFIWIFGTGRSGSTWIAKMMRDLRGYSLWNEPLVGHMFGTLYHERGERLQESSQFLLGGEKESWLPPVREYLLSAATAKYPHHAGEDRRYLVVKEPHGSIGADIISEALPESRMVVLLRDPRDVMSSKLDAHRPGNWAKKGNLYEDLDGDETKYVISKSHAFLGDMKNAFRGYDRHPGPKAVIRYEDFRAEPEVHLKKLLSELDLPFREADIPSSIQNNSWEKIPEEEKGPGKIRRKASPGGWREDLTPEQARSIEGVTASYLREHYPETIST